MTIEMINIPAFIAITLLSFLVLYGYLKNRTLRAQNLKSDLDLQNLLLAIDEALLLIEDDKVFKMNHQAHQLFGNLEHKSFRCILYHTETDLNLPFDTVVNCQCIGKDQYLFPAELQAMKHEESPRWMLKITDKNFNSPNRENKTRPLSIDNDRSGLVTNQKNSFIVIVDDDESVLDTYRDMIAFEGWNVQAFISGDQALKEIQAQPNSIKILITDYKLREMTGVELINKSRELVPDLKSIVISGFSLSEAQLGSVIFIQKPCPRDQLINTIREQLETDENHSFEVL